MKRFGNKIRRVLAVDPETFSVRLQYADGLVSAVSLAHLFSKPRGLAAEILRGGLFEKCFVELGALAWPNGFELCADAVKMWDREQHNHHKIAA